MVIEIKANKNYGWLENVSLLIMVLSGKWFCVGSVGIHANEVEQPVYENLSCLTAFNNF